MEEKQITKKERKMETNDLITELYKQAPKNSEGSIEHSLERQAAEKIISLQKIISRQDTIEHAFGILTEAIGVYGERTDAPVKITWGNGIALSHKNTYFTAGTKDIMLYLRQLAGKL